MTEQRIPSATAPREAIVIQAHLDTLASASSPGAEDAGVRMCRPLVACFGDHPVTTSVTPRERFAAGPIRFTKTHFAVDGETHALANTVATPDEIKRAGTRNVPPSDGRADPGERIIQGPQFGTPAAKSKKPGMIAGWLQRQLVRFNFGRADNWQNRLRLGEAPIVDYARLDGKTVDANVKTWGMKRGDWFLVGDTHCGHLMVHGGENEKGETQVVHSMATKYENKSLRQWVRVLLEIAFSRLVLWRRLDKTGVIKEGLAEFLDRNSTGTLVGQCDPRWTDAMRDYFWKLVEGDVGKDYNGNLTEDEKRIYCSQLLAKNIIATYVAFGLTPPRINTCLVHHAQGKFFEMRAFVATPENVSVSPDFAFLGFEGHGKSDMVQNLKTMVRPES